MKIEKIKISDLPEVDSVASFYTLGVDDQNRSVKVGLEFLHAAAAAVDTAVESAADTATQVARETVQQAVTQTDAARDAANTAAAAAKAAADRATSIINQNTVHASGFDCIVLSQQDMDELLGVDPSSVHNILIAEDVGLIGDLYLQPGAQLTVLPGKVIFADYYCGIRAEAGSGCRVHHAKFICQGDLGSTLFEGVDFIEQVQVEVYCEVSATTICLAKTVRDFTLTASNGGNHSNVIYSVDYLDNVYICLAYSTVDIVYDVRRVQRCVVELTGGYNNAVFSGCYGMSHCEVLGGGSTNSTYYYCFADSRGTSPANDTPEGGFNSIS